MNSKEAHPYTPSLGFSISLAVLSAIGCSLFLLFSVQAALIGLSIASYALEGPIDRAADVNYTGLFVIALVVVILALACAYFAVMLTLNCGLMCIGMLLSHARPNRLSTYQRWVQSWPNLVIRPFSSSRRLVLELSHKDTPANT